MSSVDSNQNPGPQPQQIIVQAPKESFLSRMASRLFYTLFGLSILLNISLLAASAEYFATDGNVKEKYHSGSKTSDEKIAIVEASGTIMPPNTEKIIAAIKKAKDDDDVKGVLLKIDSPGGMVTDSHQIYHQLELLRVKKPIFVIMEDFAASGGYYIAMGAGKEGKIFAEPTTWTGSIGVILPHYQMEELVEKLGIKVNPLKTGQFKDALSPFRPMTPEDEKLWTDIIDQAFQRFLGIIVENRKEMPMEKLKPLAQGQVFTSDDAVKNGLVDQIGFEEDALAALKTKLNLSDPRIVKYEHEAGLSELLMGAKMGTSPREQWREIMEQTVPRAMYYCSWLP
ncbi:MAG: signal peptide peptidase SppA [Planctomycetaceae bacterium]|nr:signal peptide peptidase SppA [Planctomycetaceae bacterium]